MKNLNFRIKYLYENGKMKPSLNFVIEFYNSLFLLVFIFNFYKYLFSFFLFLVFIFLYYKDIKLYSIFKSYIIEKIGIDLYLWFCNSLIFCILIFFIFVIIILYKNDDKDTFKFRVYTFIYHRIHFLINYSILKKILNITPIEFFEYNFIIILIFMFYCIFLLISIITKKEINLKLLHYLSWPWISIIFWLWLYYNVKNLDLFDGLYKEIVGFDDKYYDIYYKDFRDYINT